MIIFRKLVLNNFMSYKGKTVVHLSGQGVVRIEGRNLDDAGATSNMAGKSAIIEALLWCLFGKTLRGLKHDGIINRRAKRNCSVTCEFRIGNGIFHIQRFRRSENGNGLRIHRDGRLLNWRRQGNTQERLERILDTDFQAFVNSTVFGGFDGARRQFALLADSDQKKILDSFLRFERFELALERTKHFLSIARQTATENTIALTEQSGLVNTYKEKVAALLTSTNILRDRERRERKRLISELRSIKPVDTLQYDSGIEEASGRVESLTTKLSRLQGSQDVARRSLNKLKKAVSNRKSMVGKRCPTCGQLIKLPASGLEDHLRMEMGSVRNIIEGCEVKIARLERRVTHWRKELKRLTTKKELKNKTKLLREMRKKEIGRRLKVGPQAKSSADAQSPVFEQLDETRQLYSKALSRYLVMQQKDVELTRRIKDLTFWEVGFGNKGVKTIVMREMLPSMNARLKQYAAQMFRSQIELEFRPSRTTKRGDERELFHLHYKSRLNSTSYAGESSGGRRRIDICVLLVFAWLARCSNLLLVDELLDGLDESGRQTTLDILSRQRGTVFVITHSRQLKSSIGRVWTVVKKNGISRLETL